MQEFTSGLSMLFHWSLCLSLCQDHTALITVSFAISLRWQVSGLQLCSSFSRLFWLFESFVVHMNFRITFSVSAKNATGIFIELHWISDGSGQHDVLTVLSSNPWTWMSFHSPGYFSNVLWFSVYQSFTSLVKAYSYSFWYCYTWNCFLNFIFRFFFVSVKETTNSCLLIWYPATLLNLLVLTVF